MKNTIYPTSIPDFLSTEEIKNIKTSVLELSKNWRKISDETKSNRSVGPGAYTLGRAAYCIRNKYEKYNKDNPILISNFSTLYDKTTHLLKNYLNIDQEIYLLNDFTVPGFHIFSGPIPAEKFLNLHFHVDSSIAEFYENVDIKSVCSFSSIIEGKSQYLEYRQNGRVQKFDYYRGNLNLWSANVEHRIGCRGLSAGEYRITYQGHLFKYRKSHYMFF